MRSHYLIIAILSLVLGSCATTPKKPSGSITVMAYNVENLFDNLDDPGKEDETYLPLADKSSPKHRTKCHGTSNDYYKQQCLEVDWNDKKIEMKLKRVADVIMQEGTAPDILIMEEVENLNILERLRAKHLAKAGYKETILIEGPDERGIDVAMLSKLPLASPPKLHEIDLTGTGRDKTRKPRPTRGILQSQFKLPDNTVITVFGVHFPSQGNPTAARRAAIKKLNELKKALPKDAIAIAGGDFNITMKEDAQEGLYSKELAQEWLVSHEIGCQKCEGTHNYRGEWSFLDALLFSKNMKSEGAWKVLPQTIRVANKSIYQMNHWGSPARFSERSQVGVSDHWPLAVEIVPAKEVAL